MITRDGFLRVTLLAAILAAVPVALSAQQAEEWDWDADDHGAEEGERPVLVVQSSGGDLSAVAADSVAGHPRLRRYFEVQRRDERQRDVERDAYLLMNVSAASLARERGRRDVALVISRLDPSSREVLDVRRFVGESLESVLEHAGDLSEHFDSVRRHLLREPAWYLEQERKPDAFVSVGRGISDSQANAMFEAQTVARRNVERAVADAAGTVATRFLARRDLEVEFDDKPSMQGSLERLTLNRNESLEWREDNVVVYVELQSSLDDARRAFLRTVRHLLGDRRANDDELLAILRAYMEDPEAPDDGSGYVPDTPDEDEAQEPDEDERDWPELESTEIEERQDEGRGFQRITVVAEASGMREAMEFAQWRAAYDVLSEEQRAQWGTIREHRASQMNLGRATTTTVRQMRNLPRQRIRATVQVRINERDWIRWVERILR